MKTLTGVLVLLVLGTGSLTAQMRRGGQAECYGVSVITPTVNQTTPSAVLPVGELMATDQASDVAVAGLVTAQNAFAIVNGDLSDGSGAVSTATLGAVNILDGLITADGVVAIASSTAESADAEGSSLAHLVVNGVDLDNPEPNTRVDLAGKGYVVLNERIRTAGGIKVNMIHVVLQEPILGALGAVIGYRANGEIIVGSATSIVN